VLKGRLVLEALLLIAHPEVRVVMQHLAEQHRAVGRVLARIENVLVPVLIQ
jgi:hypothetical protein